MPTVKIDLSDTALMKLRNEIYPPASIPPPPNIYPPLTTGCWFIRTVTYHLVGRIVGQSNGFLILEDASWVADSGRFMNALRSGSLREVEPVGAAVVNISTIVDAFPWTHVLPTDQK